MKSRIVIVAFAALFVIAACDKRGVAPRSASSVAAEDAAAPTPIGKPYRYSGGSEFDIERLLSAIPPEFRPSYEKSTFDRSTGATIVTNLRFGVATIDGALTVRRAEIYGADLEKIEGVKAGSEAALDAPFSTIVSKLRLFDIEYVAPGSGGASTKIGALELDNLRIRDGGVPKESAAHGLAAFFNAFDIAGLYLRDLRHSAKFSGDSKTGSEYDFSAEDLRVVGISAGRIKALIGIGLEFGSDRPADPAAAAVGNLGPILETFLSGPLRNLAMAKDQRTKIETLEWRNISFAGLLRHGLNGEKPPLSARDLIDLGTIRLSNVETFVDDKRFSAIRQTDVSAIEFAWLAPSKIRAVSRGGINNFTVLVPDKESDAIAVLKARKLDRVSVENDFAYDWSPDRGSIVLSAGYRSDGLANLQFDVALEGLELEKIDDAYGRKIADSVIALAKLKSFLLVISDEQMLDAFYELTALQSGRSAEEVRAEAPMMMRFIKLEIGDRNPKAAGILGAIIDFLEYGGTLEIRAAPQSGMPLSAVGAATEKGPDAIIAAANITVVRKD